MIRTPLTAVRGGIALATGAEGDRSPRPRPGRGCLERSMPDFPECKRWLAENGSRYD